MSQSRSGGDPLISSFKNDPDMAPLIEEFVTELGQRVRELEQNFAKGDSETVKRLAHQLKGAGSGYGFDPITMSAAKLELALKTVAGDLASVRNTFEDLIETCRRARV